MFTVESETLPSLHGYLLGPAHELEVLFGKEAKVRKLVFETKKPVGMVRLALSLANWDYDGALKAILAPPPPEPVPMDLSDDEVPLPSNPPPSLNYPNATENTPAREGSTSSTSDSDDANYEDFEFEEDSDSDASSSSSSSALLQSGTELESPH